MMKINKTISRFSINKKYLNHQFYPIFRMAEKANEPAFYSLFEDSNLDFGYSNFFENLELYGKIRIR